MGKMVINGKPVVAPAAEMKVEDLKELADIPQHEVLYDPETGRVLKDEEVVKTDEKQLGATEDWDRGR
jgi:hypothetical protein